jgi:hypothetical protein
MKEGDFGPQVVMTSPTDAEATCTFACRDAELHRRYHPTRRQVQVRVANVADCGDYKGEAMTHDEIGELV